MIIKVLAENTSVAPELGSEHGLSLYIETRRHKLLFDTGASALFVQNAAKLDVDLAAVDTVILSHGHYDHGGGLKAFMEMNSNAQVYLNRAAFAEHCSKRANGEIRYIGLDSSLLPSERFVFTGDRLKIDGELELFTAIKRCEEFVPAANQGLLVRFGGSLVADDFAHEQNLVIRENGKALLLTGCAHAGIVNIIGRFHELTGGMPDYVVGGFHLARGSAGQSESPSLIQALGRHLAGTRAMFYTCHCTGIQPYSLLREVMAESIKYISTGDQILIKPKGEER